MRSLLNYLPEHIRQIQEFKALMDAEQPEIAAIVKVCMGIQENQFAETADENGLARLERAWRAPEQAGGTIEERRYTLKTLMLDKRPGTERFLRVQLAGLCGADGYTLEVIAATYTLRVRLALASKRSMAAVVAMIERLMPAVMVLDIDLLYNRHGQLTGKTFAQLAALSHQHIRDEVI